MIAGNGPGPGGMSCKTSMAAPCGVVKRRESDADAWAVKNSPVRPEVHRYGGSWVAPDERNVVRGVLYHRRWRRGRCAEPTSPGGGARCGPCSAHRVLGTNQNKKKNTGLVVRVPLNPPHFEITQKVELPHINAPALASLVLATICAKRGADAGSHQRGRWFKATPVAGRARRSVEIWTITAAPGSPAPGTRLAVVAPTMMRATTTTIASTIAACMCLSTAAHAQDEGTRKLPRSNHRPHLLRAPTLPGSWSASTKTTSSSILGVLRGAADGNIVDLWRPFRLRHPVTGQTLSDRFRIGTLRLVQVQKTLSLARPEGKLARAAAPGDSWYGNRRHRAPPPAARDQSPAKPISPTPLPDRAAEPIDVEARDLSVIFDSLKGQAIDTRIWRYEQYATVAPHRPLHARSSRRGQRAATPSQRARHRPQEPAPKPRPGFAAPPSALASNALTLGVETPSRERRRFARKACR